MARLPNPGSDDNVWGDVLNDFLLQSHKTGGGLKDDIVGATQIQDNSISAGKLQTDAVTTIKIQNDAVTTAKIVDDAVTTAKIATTNNPGNGNYLSYNGSAMTWATPSGGAGPQIFVQSTDPGVSAQDGDIWIDTSA
ncbi:MAG TPA: hypothetical protein VLF62_00525 [Candidatus Saccharimonadales bacterium]|nr:hypothetical protein [Candidatus Saccharimonadales bacterium]